MVKLLHPKTSKGLDYIPRYLEPGTQHGTARVVTRNILGKSLSKHTRFRSLAWVTICHETMTILSPW